MNEEEVKENMINDVANAIVANRLVLFIGAGFAMNIKLPSWKKLINYLLDKYLPNKPENKEKREAVESLIKNDYLSVAIEKIAEFHQPHTDGSEIKTDVVNYLKTAQNKNKDEINTNPSYKYLLDLYKCGATKIVTTNYDDSITSRLNSSGIKILSFDTAKIDYIKNSIIDDNYYLKLHGGLSPNDNMILFEKDYRNNYLFNDQIPDLLQELFTHNRILFIGCGLNDRYMDIFERLRLRNAVLESYVICCDEEHTKVAARNGIQRITINNYKDLPDLLKEILDRTRQERQKKAKDIIFSDVPLETYDYASAGTFFDKIRDKKTRGCYFFNTQVNFNEWFSPLIQLHLVQQMEAVGKHFKNSEFDHYRVLILPYSKELFLQKIKEDPFFRHGIKALKKIHDFMRCKLAFVTSDVFEEIYKNNKDFIEKNYNVFGLDALKDHNYESFDEVLKKQSKNGYRRKNDLDFSVIKAEHTLRNKANNTLNNIWQANFEEDENKFKYTEITDSYRDSYNELFEMLISHIKNHEESIINPEITINRKRIQLRGLLEQNN